MPKAVLNKLVEDIPNIGIFGGGTFSRRFEALFRKLNLDSLGYNMTYRNQYIGPDYDEYLIKAVAAAKLDKENQTNPKTVGVREIIPSYDIDGENNKKLGMKWIQEYKDGQSRIIHKFHPNMMIVYGFYVKDAYKTTSIEFHNGSMKLEYKFTVPEKYAILKKPILVGYTNSILYMHYTTDGQYTSTIDQIKTLGYTAENLGKSVIG